MTPFALFLAATFALIAPAQADGGPPLAQVNARFAQDYLRPAVSDFAQGTQALERAVSQHCAGREGREGRVQAALKHAVEGWGRLAIIHLPLTQDRNRNLRILFHPDPRGTGERQLRKLLNGKDPVTDVSGKSIGLRGLSTLDRLMGQLDNARACTLAKAVAGDLYATAQEMAVALPDYAERLTNPSADNPLYRSPQEAAGKVLASLATSTAAMRDLVVVPTLGDSPAASRWKAAPMRRSGLTFTFLDAQLAGMGKMLALVEPDGAKGVTEARDATAFEITNLRRQIQAIDKPLEELATSSEGRAKLVALRYGLDGLERAAHTRLMASLGLQSGFNALDGD